MQMMFSFLFNWAMMPDMHMHDYTKDLEVGFWMQLWVVNESSKPLHFPASIGSVPQQCSQDLTNGMPLHDIVTLSVILPPCSTKPADVVHELINDTPCCCICVVHTDLYDH